MKTEFPIAEKTLSEEDYKEPCCPLSKPSDVSPIPIRRIIEKLDAVSYTHLTLPTTSRV